MLVILIICSISSNQSYNSQPLENPISMNCKWKIRDCTTSAQKRKFKDCVSHIRAKYPELWTLKAPDDCEFSWDHIENSTRVGRMLCGVQLGCLQNGFCEWDKYEDLFHRLEKDKSCEILPWSTD